MIGETISHYRIIKRLGSGGMGEVYQAEDTRLRRPVALKMMLDDGDQNAQARTRFLREAQASSALNHPTSSRFTRSTRSNATARATASSSWNTSRGGR
jgi:serine/threonine protein kinase